MMWRLQGPGSSKDAGYHSAEFPEGCTISSSNTIGFGSVFGFSHFFHDSL